MTHNWSARVWILTLCMLMALVCSCSPAASGNRVNLTDTLQADLIFTVPAGILALSSDKAGNVYAVTVDGTIVRVAPDGSSKQLYSGLKSCGFSLPVITILPGGDIVFNDCVDQKDTLIKLDQQGNKSTLIKLDENLIAMSSDSAGQVYLGFWTSKGNLTVVSNPNHLTAAEQIGGQVSVLSADGQLKNIYTGGLPFALSASEEGALVAATWGKSGPVKSENKSYSVCASKNVFWAILSGQVAIDQLAADQSTTPVTNRLKAVSALTLMKGWPAFAVGMDDTGKCGIYAVEAGQTPVKLSFNQADVDKYAIALASTGNVLYFADEDGHLYKVDLGDQAAASNEPAAPAANHANAPQPGHWQGGSAVSFDVLSNGNLRNFKLDAYIPGGSHCKLALDQIVIQPDNTFVYTNLIKESSYWPGESDTYKAKGIWPTPVMQGNDAMVEALRINGLFDSTTTVTGTYRILVCEDQHFIWAKGQGTSTWSAAWQGTSEPATPSPVPTRAQLPPTWTPVAQPTPAPTMAPTTAAATVAPTLAPKIEPTSASASWQPLPDLPRQINSLAVDPANPHMLYAATGQTGSGSGVYQSEDAGLTWQRMSTGLPNEDVLALAFSADNPPVLYAAVGPDAFFASADSAKSWTRIGKSELAASFKRLLAVAPGNGKTLFTITTARGIARSTDQGHNWQIVGNGLPTDNNDTINVQALAIDPTDAKVIYVGTGWESFNGNGVYKSIDGGTTWSPANRGMLDYGISALAVDPANAQTVYAGGIEGNLFKSSDSGQTWTDLTDKLPARSTSIRQIMLDPARPQTVYLLSERTGILLSADGGLTWRELGQPTSDNSASLTAMTVIFNSQPIVIAGLSGTGGWRYAEDQSPLATPATAATPTPSAGAAAPSLVQGSWQTIPDLPRNVNALSVDPAQPQVFYAGTGSNGSGSGVYKSADAGLTWQRVSTGLPDADAVNLAFSHTTPPVLYAVVQNGIYASADGGISWSKRAESVGNYRGFTRIRVASSDEKILYGVAIIEGAFRSDNGGRNWQAISQGLPKDANGSLNAQSLAIDPTNAKVVYLGTGWDPFGGNGVYKSTDGGATWAAANHGMLDYSITALAVDPVNPQIIYAGGYEGELFKSTDGGATWNKIKPDLLDRNPIREIVIDPAKPEVIYLLGEQSGVLVSTDGGTTWYTIGKPSSENRPQLKSMAVAFDTPPSVIIGAAGEGGWQYVMK